VGDLPRPDTLEVSVFGKGIGECVVVHMGGGEWMVVDSLRNSATGNPVAFDYLSGLGVDLARAVKLVVVTHWHRDHTQGLADLFSKADAARVVFSQALRSSEFRNLLGCDVASPAGSSLNEMRDLVDILRTRKRSKVDSLAEPLWAVADRHLLRTPHCEVISMSPSDAAISAAHREIAALLPLVGSRAEPFVAPAPNETSIVLGVRVGSKVVILGADLEAGSNSTRGWKAIAASWTSPLPLAACFKIPHHGSKSAHEPAVWKELLVPSPMGVLTPYRASKHPIPSETDLERLRACTSQLYCAGALSGVRPPRRPASVQKIMGKRCHVVESNLGHVRARLPPSGDPVVELFGEARLLA
jgi:hypothetical protein